MLKSIRKIKEGWFVILIGFAAVVSGMAFKERNVVERTLLCFDEGCIYIQGISNMVVGILFIGFGVYLNLKK